MPRRAKRSIGPKAASSFNNGQPPLTPAAQAAQAAIATVTQAKAYRDLVRDLSSELTSLVGLHKRVQKAEGAEEAGETQDLLDALAAEEAQVEQHLLHAQSELVGALESLRTVVVAGAAQATKVGQSV